MENLIINATPTTPEINFDASKGVLLIAGESYPENAIDFYKPVFSWIRLFIANNQKKITVNFKMIYFNTSSSKAILDMMDIFEEKYKKDSNIEINWYFQEDDEDIQESGEEFAEGLSIPYNIISYE